MYNERITLTPQELLDKEFKIDARGYRPQEVDKFLDMVAKARKYYLERHPKAKLPDYPNFAKQEESPKVLLQIELTSTGLNLTATKLKKNNKNH